MRILLTAALMPCILLGACGRNDQASPAVDLPEVPPGSPEVIEATAQVILAGRSGTDTVGGLHLRATATGVTIEGTITGLAPETVHAIHVHETGDCSVPDASSAGDHFNPGNHPHGGPGTRTRHLGDLPNLQADSEGNAGILVTVEGASLQEGSPYNVNGRAVVIHADPDDYSTQPAGQSGERIACGVISLQSPVLQDSQDQASR